MRAAEEHRSFAEPEGAVLFQLRLIQRTVQEVNDSLDVEVRVGLISMAMHRGLLPIDHQQIALRARARLEEP